MTRTRLAITGLMLTFVVGLSARDARTQPTRGRPKVATQADIQRLERQLAEQQRLFERFVRLQQQYLASLAAMMASDGTAPPPPVPTAPPAAVAVPPPVEPTTKPTAGVPAVEKPAAKVEPAGPKGERRKAATGNGTIVGKVKGGSDVFVYIEDVVASAKGSAVMKQEGKQFSPRVLAVQKGTRVEFPNRDAVFHNVFSVTPDNSFDLGSYSEGESKSVAMNKPGVVSVYCNMHPQMTAYILVVPGNLFVRAGQDGFYRLPNVPAGRHRLVAWAPNSKPVVKEVDVPEDEVVTVELEVKKGRATPHTNKDGLPYGSYKD
jgi:plastocyanin